MKNQVIKVLNEEHGKKVIAYWKSKGVDTKDCKGTFIGDYYGILDGMFSAWEKKPKNTEEIFLLPKRGDKILVWDNGNKEERIFLTFIEGAVYPIICVKFGSEDWFFDGEKFYIDKWKNWSFIEEEIIEFTIEDIAKLTGIKSELIRIKK